MSSANDATTERLAALEARAAAQATVSDRSEAQDRSWIARRIINIFVGAVGAVLFLLLLEGLGKGEWSIVTSQAADVIKTAVLPVVTLVLGFYFGSRASGKG